MNLRNPVMVAAALLAAGPAAAEVMRSTEAGFAAQGSVLLAATPQQAWSLLVRPAEWWEPSHTWSGDAANLALSPTAGGCFCETLPAAAGGSAGSVRHMVVVHARPAALLVMDGALGPLQSEALKGVLTVNLAAEGQGTRLTWSYFVGGFSRSPLPAMAQPVDTVIGGQFARLAARAGRDR